MTENIKSTTVRRYYTMAVNNYQFIQTFEMFRDYLSDYPKDLTYDDWNKADAEDKAVLLYVHFFKEVTLAWYNAIVSRNISYVTQEDAISIVLQYLMKNVSKIMEDESKYASNYIYRVCYNCIGCLPRPGVEKMRDACVISNEYVEGDVAVDFFDLVPSKDDDPETIEIKEAIWEVIRHMGPKAEKVVNHIINPKDTLKRVTKNSAAGKMDRLADISVSEEEYAEIVAELKIKLAPYKDAILIV